MRFRLDGVVTVVDAVNGAATLDAHVEAVKQVAVADRIVLTKTDLLDSPERRDAAAACARGSTALNPAAPVIEARRRERRAADRLRALRSGAQDPRREALARRGSLCGRARPSSPSSRREPARRPHPRLHARERAGDSVFGVRDVPRPVALDARAEPAAREGHREARRDAGAAGRDPRRAAHLPSARDACRLAGRGPPHPAGVHRERHPRRARSRTCSTPSSASPSPTSPTAPRSPTIR